jgi:predicted short-subunit dehydrogenase-like oxidoreductase (DUF2520 family)
MKVTFIGSGNMASHLAPLFATNGYIVSIYSRNKNTASAIALLHNITLVDQIEEIDADVIILCVNDDAITQVAEQLKNSKALIIHTSGSTSSQALSSCENTGVMYPLQSMKFNAKLDYKNIPVCIYTANETYVETLKSMAHTISDKVYFTSDHQRAKVHLAAVITNNFINHLVVKAKNILKNSKLDYELIVPLLKNTLEKLTDVPYNFQQTGPASRGDTKIITQHMATLKEEDEFLADIYHSITKSIMHHENSKRSK